MPEVNNKMQTKAFSKKLLASATAFAVAGTVFSGLAATNTYAAQLEEIIVTARKRDESLLDIPFAISAFTEQDLQNADLKDFTDLSLFTPGLTFQNAGGNRADRGSTNIIIRGLNLQSFSGSSDPALLFIDGAPVFGGEIGSFVDIARVEVLRGPQTAYFGRNTFSGAINLVTKDPGEELGGFVGVEYGSFGTTDVQGSLEGSIIPEKLSVRVSGRRTDKGGQYKNNFNGKREIGAQLSESFVGTVVFRPTDSIKLKVRGNYSELEDRSPPNIRFPGTFANCDPDGDGSVTWICGEAPGVNVAKPLIGSSDAFDPEYFNNYKENVIDVYSLYSGSTIRSPSIGGGVFIDKMGLAKEVRGLNFQATIDLPGETTLDWISAYAENKQITVNDENSLATENTNRGGGVLSDVFHLERYDENISHEIRLVSDSEQRLRWIGGANYIEVENIASCIAGVFFAPTSFTCRPILEVTTKGVFGGLYYDITEKLTISGELRYQNDQIDIPSGGLSTEFDDVGGRATIEYALNEDLMIFANFSRGFRPGGFNSIYTTLTPGEAEQLMDATGTGLDVDPESLDQYEIGIKGGLFDGRLQGSAVAYTGEITDQQVQQVGNFVRESDGTTQVAGVLANIGTLGLHGIELEAGFAATERLTLQGSFAWNYTEFKDGACRACVSNGAAVTDQDYLGNQLFWAPEYTASMVATYARPLFDGAVDGFARLEVIYESTKYATEMNLYETGARELVNLRVGVEKDAYRVEFYVANLFDNDTYFNVSRNSDLDTFGNAFVAGLPDRQRVGVRAFVNF